MTDDDHFGQNNPITLTINQSFVSNDYHFGHKSPSLWVYIYCVYIYISISRTEDCHFDNTFISHWSQTSRLCIPNTRLGLPLFPYPKSNRTLLLHTPCFSKCEANVATLHVFQKFSVRPKACTLFRSSLSIFLWNACGAVSFWWHVSLRKKAKRAAP